MLEDIAIRSPLWLMRATPFFLASATVAGVLWALLEGLRWRNLQPIPDAARDGPTLSDPISEAIRRRSRTHVLTEIGAFDEAVAARQAIADVDVEIDDPVETPARWARLAAVLAAAASLTALLGGAVFPADPGAFGDDAMAVWRRFAERIADHRLALACAGGALLLALTIHQLALRREARPWRKT